MWGGVREKGYMVKNKSKYPLPSKNKRLLYLIDIFKTYLFSKLELVFAQSKIQCSYPFL